MDRDIISVVIGNERETAVSASSLTHETNMASTKLYEYCINIENSGGKAMFIIKGNIGFVAILF